MTLPLRRVSFNNMLPVGGIATTGEEPRHTPPSVNLGYVYHKQGPKLDTETGNISTPSRTIDVERMFNFSMGEKPETTATAIRRERYRLPPAPLRGILKGSYEAPIFTDSSPEVPSLEGALDQVSSEEDSEQEEIPPSFGAAILPRKKSIAEMTPEEIIALDAMYENRSKVDIEGMKFDRNDNLYFVLSAAAVPQEARQKAAMAAKLEGFELGDHGYPTRPAVDYAAVSLTSHVALPHSLESRKCQDASRSPDTITRRVLHYRDPHRGHSRRALEWYFHSFCQAGDHLIVVVSADTHWSAPRSPGARRGSDDTASRPPLGRASLSLKRIQLAEAHAATLLEWLCGVTARVPADGGFIRITVEVADLPPKSVIRSTAEVYEPHMILLGDQSTNLNLRAVAMGCDGKTSKRIVGLTRYTLTNCGSCPVVIAGRSSLSDLELTRSNGLVGECGARMSERGVADFQSGTVENKASMERGSARGAKLERTLSVDKESAIVLDDESIRSEVSLVSPGWDRSSFMRMLAEVSDASVSTSASLTAKSAGEVKPYSPFGILFAQGVKAHDSHDLYTPTSRPLLVYTQLDKLSRVKSLLDEPTLSKLVSAASGNLRVERRLTNGSSTARPGDTAPPALALPDYGAAKPAPRRKSSVVEETHKSGFFLKLGFGKKKK